MEMYEDLCEILETEVKEIKTNREQSGIFTMADLQNLKYLLVSIKSIKEIMEFKEMEEEKKHFRGGRY